MAVKKVWRGRTRSSSIMNALTAVKIAAENPASIAMAMGGVMVAIGRGEGWALVFIGAILNAIWIFEG